MTTPHINARQATTDQGLGQQTPIEVVANAYAACPTRCDTHRDQLIVQALPLADQLAGRYRWRGLEPEDLVQVARLALVKAVVHYEPRADIPFRAYATPTILGELKRTFRDQGWSVRPPRRLQELRLTLRDAEEEARHTLGREPSPQDIAAVSGLTQEQVAQGLACSLAYRAASLDLPSDGLTAWPAVLTACDDLARIDTHMVLRAALQALDARDRDVVQLRFVEELSQSEIGERIGVTQMQVSRILRRIVAALRTELLDAA